VNAPVLALARADARALVRDPMLRAMLIAPLGLLGLLQVGVPLVEGWLGASYGIDLAPHRAIVVAFLVAVTLPLLFGAFAGLLLLEDRESGVLPAIAVSPAGVRSYLVVRCGWAAVATAVATGGALAIEPAIDPLHAILAGTLAAGSAAVVALLVGGLATDRLEGMAVTKAMMLPLAASVLVWPLGTSRGWPLAVLPTFGPVAVLHHADRGGSLVVVAGIGLVATATWCTLLGRRLVRRPH
jgi:fluoroquinolone transport system permease protein